MGAGGIGGMDIDGMIYQIMEAEQEPIMNQYQQTEEVNQQIEAYQDINSKLDTFKRDAASIDADTFGAVAESSDEDVVTAEADSDVDSASYDVEVEQLAQKQRIVATGDVDPSDLSGGEFHLRIEDDIGFGVYLDDDVEELSDIASAINNAKGNDDLVQATVIEDNLVLEVSDSNTDLIVEDGEDVHDEKGVLENLGILDLDDDSDIYNRSTIELGDDLGDEGGTLEIEVAEELYEVDIEEGDSAEDLASAIEAEIGDEDTAVELDAADDIVITSEEDIETEEKGNTGIAGIDGVTDGESNYVLDSEELTDYDDGGRLLQKSQGAEAYINGLEVTSDDNTLDDAVDGVTFDLQQDTGSATIDVDTDTEGIREEIEGFVESYNSVIDMIDLYTNPQRTEEGEELDEEGAEEVIEGGILQGESQLRTLQSQLHNSVVMPVDDIGEDGEEMTLSQFGIQVQDDGRLEIDEAGRGWGQTLDEAIENDLDELREVFARESANTIEGEDLDKILDEGEFTLEVSGEESTVSADNGSFDELDSLIEAINDSDDGISRVIASEDDNGNLELTSFRELEHGALQEQMPGIADRVEGTVEAAVGSQFGSQPGYIGEPGGDVGRIPTLENEIDRINENIERDLDRLESREDSLRAQFTRMQQATAEMQAQQQQMASQIGTLGI